VLREARIGERVAATVATMSLPAPEEIEAEIVEWVRANEAGAWPGAVAEIVSGIVERGGADGL